MGPLYAVEFNIVWAVHGRVLKKQHVDMTQKMDISTKPYLMYLRLPRKSWDFPRIILGIARYFPTSFGNGSGNA